MKNAIRLIFICVLLILNSCVSSMSPLEVNSTLPLMTKAKLISELEAERFVKSGNCKYLVRNRSYVAPIGLTPKQDLKGGAKGIDEWVTLDGGNAYVLKNFKWIAVGDDGATELHLEFDTMHCD